jgi:hypothetical protein
MEPIEAIDGAGEPPGLCLLADAAAAEEEERAEQLQRYFLAAQTLAATLDEVKKMSEALKLAETKTKEAERCAEIWQEFHSVAASQAEDAMAAVFREVKKVAYFHAREEAILADSLSLESDLWALRGALNQGLHHLGLGEVGIKYFCGTFVLKGSPQEAAAALRRAADQLDLVVS